MSRLHYRGEPFQLDALGTELTELTEAARARADAARRRWPMLHPCESVSHGNTVLATIGCVGAKRRAGPPMT